MSSDRIVLQMIRILPMVDALHRQARLSISGGMGAEAADYAIMRLNTYVKKIIATEPDDMLEGLLLSPSQSAMDEQKMQLLTIATAELLAYLRQRIGISINDSGPVIGTVIHQAVKEHRDNTEM